MRIETEITKVRAFLHRARRNQACVGFVPTMGALHEGHLSLIRRSVMDTDVTVVSVFVNPTQFAPQEDFEAYPRLLREDAIAAESAGAHLIFAPTADGMYAPDASTSIGVAGLTDGLCGKYRPGHFSGVTTVVTKLFNIIQPDRAYFGLKDYQQYVVVKRMARDLNLPVEVVGVPTVRETDGLAMSSRNAYLSAEERCSALCLSRAIAAVHDRYAAGESSTQILRNKALEIIAQEPLAKIEYLDFRNAATLEPVALADNDTLLALAVRIGKTRLIDNTILGG